MILENILQAIQANTAAIQANTAALSSPGLIAGAAVSPGAGALSGGLPAPAGIAGVQQQPPAGITADQITALIQPHVGNEAIKTELGNTMRAMGINALPEAQPHQYGALYQAFQNVIAKFTTGGAGQTQNQSII